jgi:hypothetical protein
LRDENSRDIWDKETDGLLSVETEQFMLRYNKWSLVSWTVWVSTGTAVEIKTVLLGDKYKKNPKHMRCKNIL